MVDLFFVAVTLVALITLVTLITLDLGLSIKPFQLLYQSSLDQLGS
jgi:hypothetical protein